MWHSIQRFGRIAARERDTSVARYTSYALQDPRVSWSLASVHIESVLVARAMSATGVSTASARDFARQQRPNTGTLVCRYGRSPPIGCDAAGYLAGSGACPRDECYLDPCFACVNSASGAGEGQCAAKSHDAATCEATVGCAWQRQASVDCWNATSRRRGER